MFRKLVCSVIALVCCVGLTLADEVHGLITKVDGGKITVAQGKYNKDTKKFEKGEEQTFSVADNVKVVKGKYNKDTKKLEAGDPVEGGLKNEMFSKLGDKGIRATVVTDSNKKVTEIIVSSGRGKGKFKGKGNN